MTTSSTRIDARRRAAGFSLTELIIGSSVSMIVMAGILSAFLLLGRSGMNAANYSMAEAEIRRAIEEFSQDARMASNLTWNSASSITLTLVPPNAYSALPSPQTNQVTYAHRNSADHCHDAHKRSVSPIWFLMKVTEYWLEHHHKLRADHNGGLGSQHEGK